jgi:hypothetical protein
VSGNFLEKKKDKTGQNYLINSSDPFSPPLQLSIATGLPYGSADWVAKLSAKLDLPLTIRPRGRPRKTVE